jgi:hypothetical protein
LRETDFKLKALKAELKIVVLKACFFSKNERAQIKFGWLSLAAAALLNFQKEIKTCQNSENTFFRQLSLQTIFIHREMHF